MYYAKGHWFDTCERHFNDAFLFCISQKGLFSPSKIDPYVPLNVCFAAEESVLMSPFLKLEGKNQATCRMRQYFEQRGAKFQN